MQQDVAEKEQKHGIRILRFGDVVRKTGLSRSAIYQRLRTGDFPSSVELGPRAVGFVEMEIDDYLRRLIARVRGH